MFPASMLPYRLLFFVLPISILYSGFIGELFGKCGFDESQSFSSNVQIKCKWSGNTTAASMTKGRFAITVLNAVRNRSTLSASAKTNGVFQ
jgi:hypothetical protein